MPKRGKSSACGSCRIVVSMQRSTSEKSAVLPGSGHGGPAFGKPAATKLVETFFDKYLKGADVKIELVPETDLAVPPPAAK